MPMHKLIEYSDTHFKTSGSLSRYNKDEPAFKFRITQLQYGYVNISYSVQEGQSFFRVFGTVEQI